MVPAVWLPKILKDDMKIPIVSFVLKRGIKPCDVKPFFVIGTLYVVKGG